jgi:uncharacterized protein (UPF0548 family)
VLLAWSRPSDERLDAMLARAAGASVTYDEVGATRQPTLPTGYRHDTRSVTIGHGDDAFRRGQQAIRRWEAHRAAGAIVRPGDPPALGAVTVVALRFGPTFVLAPCKVVYVTDDPARFGFAYGTLPGHPERGEEAFHVERGHDGEISFGVIAFSRPADLLGRVGSPIARAVQERVTRAYLEGVRRYVATEPDGGA